MGLIKYTLGLVMAALFVIAILAFSINFGIDNGSDIIISGDSEYTQLQSDIGSNLTTFRGDVDASGVAFATTTIDSGDQASKSGGQFKGGLGTMMSISKNALDSGFKKIFGADESFGIIFTTILAIMSFIGIMLAYKAWVGREPE